jgi:hypothetical protein
MQDQTRRDQMVSEWEFKAGIGWGRNLGRSGFFIQAAVLGQEWHAVGNAANLSADLRLFGAKVNTGFNS